MKRFLIFLLLLCPLLGFGQTATDGPPPPVVNPDGTTTFTFDVLAPDPTWGETLVWIKPMNTVDSLIQCSAIPQVWCENMVHSATCSSATATNVVAPVPYLNSLGHMVAKVNCDTQDWFGDQVAPSSVPAHLSLYLEYTRVRHCAGGKGGGCGFAYTFYGYEAKLTE